MQNADCPKHNHARVHQSRVTGVRFTAMQVPDFRDLNAYPGVVLHIREEMSLVIARMEVQKVTAFVDVNEWNHVRPAVCIYCAHIRHFLPTQDTAVVSAGCMSRRSRYIRPRRSGVAVDINVSPLRPRYAAPLSVLS